MVAISSTSSLKQEVVRCRTGFWRCCRKIRRQAWLAFRSLRVELREDLTQEVIALGLRHVRPTGAARQSGSGVSDSAGEFAIRQVRAGRRVGCRQNVNDIMSPMARRASGPTIPRLAAHPERTGGLNLLLCEDRRAGPAETAAARLDLADWFRSLSPRNRRIARALALGEQTNVVAQRFGLTAGRISQLRAWFRNHWEQFQAEAQPGDCAA